MVGRIPTVLPRGRMPPFSLDKFVLFVNDQSINWYACPFLSAEDDGRQWRRKKKKITLLLLLLMIIM